MKNKRCKWAESQPLFISYHDEEWGVPVHDDRLLFEMLNLEGAQSGLSWLTILKKRENYRQAFDNFDANKIAKYNSRKISALLRNEGIVRNRLKVNAVVGNAKAFLKIKETVTFYEYIWNFVHGEPLVGRKRNKAVSISKLMSDDLKMRGFKFVGGAICYAFMQAVGLINDHSRDCFRRDKCGHS